MDATAGQGRPKYCQECGSKIDGQGRFCGSCGTALSAEAASPQRRGLLEERDTVEGASRAALTLGGVWTFVNKLERQDASVWIARLASFAWVGAAVRVLVWWVGYLSGTKESLDAHDMDALMYAFVAASVASLALSVPLARRASGLLLDKDPSRQRQQARIGTGAVVAVFAVVALTAVSYNQVAGAIDAKKAAKRRAQEEAIILGPSSGSRAAPADGRVGR